MPVNSVEIVQTVEHVSEPSSAEVKTIETKAVVTVTMTPVSVDDDTVKTIETHEIKTEITSEPEPEPQPQPQPETIVETIDNIKLTETENNEMTGESSI